ncbi:hypothetical protein ACFW1A_24470 [Kitasatospora sp. NPDC058965]|uniref:hypothetical protein n=1 Tax=Kitasatospora sp. NPDC058965 TaxID=3346682 RepID=UPI0036A2A8DA
MSDGFEWWYFQVVDERLMLTLTVHRTDLVGGSTPYLSISALSLADGEYASWRLPVDEPARRGEPWADGLVREDFGQYRIRVAADGLSLDLALAARTGAWGPSKSLLCHDEKSGRSAYWWVKMPSGTAIGSVRWGARLFRLDASAYLDHNWGTLPLYEALTGWTWIALARADRTTVGAVVQPQAGPVLHLTNAPGGRLAQEALAGGLSRPDAPPGSADLREAERMLGWRPDSDLLRRVKHQRYRRRGEPAELSYTRWAITAGPAGGAGRILGGFMETAVVLPLAVPLG